MFGPLAQTSSFLCASVIVDKLKKVNFSFNCNSEALETSGITGLLIPLSSLFLLCVFIVCIVCRNTSPLLPRFVTCTVLFTSKESLSPSAYSLPLVQNLKVWSLMIGFLFSGLSFHGYVGESHGLVCKSLPHSGAQEKEVCSTCK